MLWDEAVLVTERVNSGLVTHMVLLQMAVAGILDKKANKAFQKQLKALGRG